MKTQLTALAALLTLATTQAAQAMETAPRISIGAATKSMAEVATAPGQTSLALVLEGAGHISTASGTIRLHAQCRVTDTLIDRKIVAGNGECEFRSTRGELGYARFETEPGVGDRGRLIFRDGQGRFAGLGTIPIDVSVNPSKVGKPVFLIENLDAVDGNN